MTAITNKRLILRQRPVGLPKESDFELVEEAIPKIAEGEVLIRNHFVSLDPAMRGWLDDRPSYLPPIQLDSVFSATTVGQIYESKNPAFADGQWVSGFTGIEQFSKVDQYGMIAPIDISLVSSPSNFLSYLGSVGMTAYFGLIDVGKPQSGDTVLVTGAAGGVGSLVGQIAKIKDCKTIGIAGGEEKCQRLIDNYGYDVAIDYRGKSYAQLSKEIAAAAPQGIDVVFENVGGDILDAGLDNINEKARIVICGLISEYSTDPVGTKNVWQLIVKRAVMEGFLVLDYVPRFQEGAIAMSQWIADGTLKCDEHIDQGIENAYDTFMKLFSGGNQGKLILDISPKTN